MDYLELVRRSLSSEFICTKTADNLLEIRLDKKELPIALVVTEEEFPNLLLLSFSLDFNNPAIAAALALHVNQTTETEVVESFYLDASGVPFFGEDATAAQAMETTGVSTVDASKLH